MKINNLETLKMVLRNGPYAWPGGYPLYLVDIEGDCYHIDCVRRIFRGVVADTKYRNGGYIMTNVEVNWENTAMWCYECHEIIDSAYGE